MSTVIALPNSTTDAVAIAQLRQVFIAHKQAFLKHPFPSLSERRAHLYALIEGLLGNRQRIQMFGLRRLQLKFAKWLRPGRLGRTTGGNRA